MMAVYKNINVYSLKRCDLEHLLTDFCVATNYRLTQLVGLDRVWKIIRFKINAANSDQLHCICIAHS